MARKTVGWRAALKPTGASPVAGVPEGQTFAGGSLLVRYANLVRLPHTLFALPFALVGTIYASRAATVTLRQLGLIVIAFTAARFAAMGFNRIVDHSLDSRNPRTRNRELPSGRLSVSQASVAVVIAAVTFAAAAGLLNRICLVLSPIALAWILVYSYTKRFTSWSHLWLGASLAIAPVGGYLAVAGRWSAPAWTLYALAGAVLCWVAGFDMFYALQDREFDHEQGLKSAVVLLGERRSITVAKVLHGVSIALLVLFGWGTGLGPLYYACLGISTVILAWEHHLVKPGDLSRLDVAFFTMNGIMSVVVFAGMLADRLL